MQRRLTVLNICIKRCKRRSRRNRRLRNKWWNLNGDNLISLKYKVIKEGSWNVKDEPVIYKAIVMYQESY